MIIKEFIKKIIPSFLINWYHLGLAFLGALFYRFPSRELIVIGVTGTQGKSTVVEFCHQIFQEAGFKTASLSSIRFKIGDRERPNLLKMTMPGRFKIQKFLREAVKAGCKYVILEVTSEGILQHRQKFIRFEVAVFTNLSPEHIERHGSFENYREAKGKLFEMTKKVHVINWDDKNKEYFLRFPAERKYLFQYEIENKKGRIVIKNTGPSKEINNLTFDLKLAGEFNVYNALAATSVALSQKISLDICQKALEKIRVVPGRMEEIISSPFKTIVDYAHTPDALQKVYETVKKTEGNQEKIRLICVLGSAGGGRDKWKRPKMGEIAAQYCDQIILTNEDPYDEDPYQILSQIKSGISNIKFSMSNFYEILDRREAIKKSLELAKPGDVIVITGKGCEPWMCLANGQKIPWDDRKIVREEYEKIRNFRA